MRYATENMGVKLVRRHVEYFTSNLFHSRTSLNSHGSMVNLMTREYTDSVLFAVTILTLESYSCYTSAEIRTKNKGLLRETKGLLLFSFIFGTHYAMNHLNQQICFCGLRPTSLTWKNATQILKFCDNLSLLSFAIERFLNKCKLNTDRNAPCKFSC